MQEAAIFNVLGEVTKLRNETEGLSGLSLAKVIANDYYGLHGYYDPLREACSARVRILMENGRACDKIVKYKRPLFCPPAPK